MENDEQISPKYKNELTLQDTNFLKGVAILLMLFHHLFLSVPNGLYDDIKIFNDIYIINGASKSAKMCVTLFVFLSGYGLMMQAKKKRGKFDLKDYYYRRIKKMYLNYWFAWLIFVPISYIVFDYTFHDAYFSSEWLHLVLDLLGVHALAFYDINSYNPTWWFYSCLIICYLIFPLLRNALKEDSLLVLIILYLISFVPISNLYSLRFNLFIFAIGILFATGKLPPPPQAQRVLDL